MAFTFTFIGLSFTLIGAFLLFFWGLPQKKIGNVILFGPLGMSYRDPQERDVPASEWQPIADAFGRRAKKLNQTGFGLVVLGTLLQIVGLFG